MPAAEIRDHETGLVSGPFSWFQSRQLFLETHETEANTILVLFSIDERFALNATSMLDQTNTSIREDFAANQINLDLLSYQKNPRVMLSSLKKIFEALKTIPPSSIESERTFSVTGFYITKFRCS